MLLQHLQQSRWKPTLLTRLTVQDSHWESANSRHRPLEMGGNWTWAMQNLHPKPTPKQRWAIMSCFYKLFSQYMSSSCCCPVYSSCANSGTLLNTEHIHMKPAFVSQSHQRKWFLINSSLSPLPNLLLFKFVPSDFYRFLFHLLAIHT